VRISTRHLVRKSSTDEMRVGTDLVKLPASELALK